MNTLLRARLALALLATSHALAQEGNATAKLCAALAEDEPRAVAKAAHATRDVAARELTSALQKALHHWAKDDQSDAELVRLFLLDALIARSANVPGDLLVPMLDEPLTEIPALVLLCRDPAMNERLLLTAFAERYSKPRGPMQLGDLRRVLVGNVLCERRAAGFAAILWPTTNAALHVTVTQPRGRIGDSMTFLLPEMGKEEQPKGFPALPKYHLFERRPEQDPVARLAADAQQHEQLLAMTPTRIGFSRNGRVEISIDAQTNWPGTGRESAWLSTLANGALELPRTQPNVTLRLADDDEAFVTKVCAARSELVAARVAMRDALVKVGLVTADEAKKCDTSVEVVVDDQRAEKDKPLPEIPAGK